MIFNEGLFLYILQNDNGVVILLMTEFDEPFRVFYEVFKPYVNKLIPICDLLYWKTTEPMVYNVVRSY